MRGTAHTNNKWLSGDLFNEGGLGDLVKAEAREVRIRNCLHHAICLYHHCAWRCAGAGAGAGVDDNDGDCDDASVNEWLALPVK